ncbi:MAG: pyrimidine-nucleoside phosphorylase [Anaeroplasmataceae bacterium]|nr:pyrimidine-nucleoside phosphorylase [Anaeroplasmataceae bacterium]MDE7384651.1 pyrimidine-nucleoside phosphorylase [Anaeroplasmataceae bacterium]
MRAVDIIIKKRDGFELTKEEIQFFIEGFTNGTIDTYQASALTMAVYFRGMTDLEATYLTESILHSGDVLDLSAIKGIKVDKHSTGGVGDKTSLVVGPLVASLGIKFAKMSGRGLGHTGGTLDKLEAIPGYDINMSEENFIKQVNKIGIALVGQTGELAPADKKLYALRDVTGTVESIPLIASSIMSKKLASGADAICLDVKVGSGAFMKNVEDATKLATLMVNIGKNCGKDMTAILTNMDEPLGLAVGNSLEVVEAIHTLNGKGPKDFTELCLEVAAHLVLAAKLANTIEEAKKLLQKQIDNKEGLNTLAKLVEAQGGDSSYIYSPQKFKAAKYITEVVAEEDGYVSHIDALAIGNAAMMLGAGRSKIGDSIDHSVGIVLAKKVNDKVCKGDVLATLHSNKADVEETKKLLRSAYQISKTLVDSKLILKIIK